MVGAAYASTWLCGNPGLLMHDGCTGTGTSGVCEDRPGVQGGRPSAPSTDAYGLRAEYWTGVRTGEFVPIPQAWKGGGGDGQADCSRHLRGRSRRQYRIGQFRAAFQVICVSASAQHVPQIDHGSLGVSLCERVWFGDR